MKRIAPRTYVDDRARYWARYPVNGRYTWKLLKETTKREAIAAAQAASGNAAASGFAALSAAYLAAGCPTRKQKFKRPSPAFIESETRHAAKLIEYFRTMPVSEVNDLLKIPQYAHWRMRQFTDGRGGRAVDKEIQTLSNVINYAVFATKQERINFIHSNRPRYHVVAIRARHRMPANADVIHQLCDYFMARPISEVFAWMTLFQMFTGCRTSELLRLRLDAKAEEAGHIAGSHLHLGRRSKSGINPFVAIGPDFARMLPCFLRWHKARFPRHQPYFPGPFGDVVGSESHCHAMNRACRKLGLPNLTPHGLRAYAATKWLREGRTHAEVAAMLGDKTAALIGSTYADAPGEAAPLHYTPSQGLPAWSVWQPESQKIVRIA